MKHYALFIPMEIFVNPDLDLQWIAKTNGSLVWIEFSSSNVVLRVTLVEMFAVFRGLSLDNTQFKHQTLTQTQTWSSVNSPYLTFERLTYIALER